MTRYAPTVYGRMLDVTLHLLWLCVVFIFLFFLFNMIGGGVCSHGAGGAGLDVQHIGRRTNWREGGRRENSLWTGAKMSNGSVSTVLLQDLHHHLV